MRPERKKKQQPPKMTRSSGEKRQNRSAERPVRRKSEFKAERPIRQETAFKAERPVRQETAFETERQPAEAGSLDRLEGRNPIFEAMRAGRSINKLWIQKREGKPDPVLTRLMNQVKATGVPILEVDRQVLDQMSETHAHQGVIAQLAAHEYADLDELVASIGERGEVPFLLILDELKESYNLGSVLRIADAAGVHGVVIPKRRSVGLDASVGKASAGAMEYVPVCRVTNISQTIETLKEKGFWITGTDASADLDYHEADWSGPLAILIGSEESGLSPVLKKHCDFLVSIPMQGHVNSLNAAVATGIVVFEAAKQRRQNLNRQV